MTHNNVIPLRGWGAAQVKGAPVQTNGNMWYMDPLPFEETLPDLLRSFRQHGLASGHSPRTIESRAQTIQRLAGDGIDPRTATRDDLTDWLADLRDSRTGEPVARSTRATYRAQLRAFCAWMLDTGRREDDPAAKLPNPRPSKSIPRPIAPQQVRAILDACSDGRARTTYAYVVLAAFAGLRVHEVAKARGEDFADGQVWVNGKGGTSSSVPMHPLVADLAATMPTSGWWFPTSSESGHVHRCSVSTAIRRAMDRAGVAGTPHALRHHFGTQALRATGGDLRMTQRLMRHASPATTAIYTQVADDAMIRAVAGIPAA